MVFGKTNWRKIAFVGERIVESPPYFIVIILNFNYLIFHPQNPSVQHKKRQFKTKNRKKAFVLNLRVC